MVSRDPALLMTSAAGTVLVGRQREQAVIDKLLVDVRSGHSRALVLRGEPGIGKTALLDEIVARAEGAAVVRLSRVQSEGEFAYGALYPVWSRFTEEGLSQLPQPQGFALRVAFGVEAGPPPNVFLVGLAMLNGVADLAEEQPLLVAVDDADWLDQASVQTLSFVARRLQAGGQLTWARVTWAGVGQPSSVSARWTSSRSSSRTWRAPASPATARP
jgi:hypothetical protein